MKQLTKISLVFLLLSSSIFFLPLRFNNNDPDEAKDKTPQQTSKTETGAMELHRHAGLASLQ